MDTRGIEAALARKYKYKDLPMDLIDKYHEFFRENTPAYLFEDTNRPLYTTSGTLICSSFDRIVIGDYGAFVEFTPDKANERAFIIAPGQEYRINDPRFSKNIKYEWWTVNDKSGVKIYKQKRSVTYAAYIPGRYYVSVHEVFPEKENSVE